MDASIKIVILALVIIYCGTRDLHAEDLVVPPVTSVVKSKFEEGAIAYSGGQHVQEEFLYRLYVPPNSIDNKSEKFPLLVWLHGFDEAGSDNTLQLTWFSELLFTQSKRKELPCFVMAFQCPTPTPSWTDGQTNEEHPLNICKAIVDDLLANRPIDRQRVVIVGVSAGGTACWDAVARYPNLFAAAVPLGASEFLGDAVTLAKSTEATSIWAFHTLKDPTAPVDSVRKTIQKIKQLGGKAYLTETPGKSHDCWTVAFRDFDLLNWLMSQKRGKTSPVPNHWSFANWKELELQEGNLTGRLALPAAIVLIVIVWLAESKRRQRMLKSKISGKASAI